MRAARRYSHDHYSGSIIISATSFFLLDHPLFWASFFWLNVLHTQAIEHRGANPPPNEGFVQHAARDT